MIYIPNKDNCKKFDTYCECMCDCGNIVTKRLNSVKKATNGVLVSCGCAIDEISNNKSKDIIGKVFGRLKVIEEIKTNNGRKSRCLCQCGNEIIISKKDVMSGHTQSCGCLQKERASELNEKDWTGYISDYGVKIINKSHQNEHGQWIWNCECYCGNIFKILPIKIANGHTTSCGCRNESSREFFIKNILLENNIDFQTQYSFSDCKNKYVLRFDFALLKNGEVFYLIEYDGMQHYKPIKYLGGVEGYEKTVSRDKIKNEYCEKNNIPLLRLKYDLSDSEIKERIVNILNP